MKTHQVKVQLGADPRVEVDGEDLTDKVNFVGFQHEHGATLPVLTLGLKANIEMEGEAVVEYESAPDFRLLLMQFLSEVDVADLEAKALESELMEDEHGMTKAIFAQLVERA